MIRRIIDFSLRQPFYILGGVLTLAAAGSYALMTLPFEAFPDLTANSVSVIADAPGMAPQDVEQLVTYPIERSLLGLPRTQSVRSTTKFGLSMTQVVFDDGVDPYFARQVVAERLNDLGEDMPADVSVTMGPVATAMGEVYQYVLSSDNPAVSAADLKTLQDYSIAPQLRTVPGVAEVNSWGGFTEQFHVVVEPGRLIQAGLTLADVERALADNNANFGGTYTEARGERFVVRGMGRLTGIDDLADVAIATTDGVPVHIHDIATVSRGALPRQGAVTIDGEGEVVAGMVIMRKGANALTVLGLVEERIDEIVPTLPAGVRLVPFYNQGDLVEQTTVTIQKNLLFGGTLVVILLWAFLRNVAASVLVALVIPLSMLWAFVSMRVFGFSANLMSLGALDFGLLVDASVVVVENVMRKAKTSESDGDGSRERTSDRAGARIRASVLEVARPVLYGIAIIIAVYIPILALQGTEGRMFRPMAFTVVAAILGSLVLAMTFVPAMAGWFLKNAKEVHTPGFEKVRVRYRALLGKAVRHPVPVVGGSAALFVIALLAGSRLGTEFMPRLDEGSVLVQGLRLPSTALDQGTRYSGALERALLALPEVEVAVSKLGRPDLATEAMGTYESDTYVTLKERSEWRPGGKDALLAAMDNVLQTVPGLEYAFTQPIQMRLDEAETGITTDVGVKIFGDDPEELAGLAFEVERMLGTVRGAADVRMTATARVKELRVEVDRAGLARYGLSSADVGHQVEMALGSSIATHVVDGPRRIGVVVRIPAGNSIDPELMSRVPLAYGPSGLVTLGSVARLSVAESPEAFAHEGGQRMVVVGANIRGRDVGSFVDEASTRLAEAVQLPAGYRFEWGGQYRNQQSAMRRLALLVPIAILAIYLLLFSTFGSVRQALMIMLNVPFAVVGGIAALWLLRLNLSTSALIGFIAVFGIAVLNGVVMVSYINQLRERGESLLEAVLDGAAVRLRPVLMTALAASLGFVPMAISTSPGAELQRPLATVVIGGLMTATLLTLFVLPTVYMVVERWLEARSSTKELRKDPNDMTSNPARLAGSAATVAMTVIAFGGAFAPMGAQVTASAPVTEEVRSILEDPRVQAAFSYLEETDAQTMADLRELTQIPAPPFMEEVRGERFRERLEEIGVDSTWVDDEGNVVGLRRGTGSGTIIFSAHLDTVFPEETDVTIRQVGDTLFAPGIADDTRGLATVLATLRAMNEANIRTGHDIWFVGTVGEEGVGDLRGMKYLFREGAPAVDAFISVDGTGKDGITSAGLGSHRYRVTFKGPGGHSWGAFGLASPVHALGRAVAHFDEGAAEYTADAPARTSYNVGRIGGGTSVNSIAFEAWMEIDMRSHTPASLNEIDAIFQAAMVRGTEEENEARLRGDPIELVVDMIGDRPSGEIADDEIFIQRAIAATELVGGEPSLGRSSTDSNIPIAQGIPSITIGGGGIGAHAHSLDEYFINRDGPAGIQRAMLILVAQAGLSTVS